MNRRMKLLPATAALIALLVLPGTAAAATTWFVDSTLGNDANSCTAPGVGGACQTIQAAINKAVSGDTINVAAGTYLEAAGGPLAVNKTLTLLGAQSGVDARKRIGPESIINDIQGTSVSANDVVIDGFTVQNSTVAAFTGFGIWLNPGKTGTEIVNNIIQDNNRRHRAGRFRRAHPALPALVPSLARPGSQATFGFVVKCCAPTGNLQYNDHQAGVRIKAQSFDGLFISSPGTSCATTPGSKHATFTGTADVIRSTGTTTEPLTVEVDDCGEPGTADTFGIETTTYSNGPSTLVGGNIQIHK